MNASYNHLRYALGCIVCLFLGFYAGFVVFYPVHKDCMRMNPFSELLKAQNISLGAGVIYQTFNNSFIDAAKGHSMSNTTEVDGCKSRLRSVENEIKLIQAQRHGLSAQLHTVQKLLTTAHRYARSAIVVKSIAGAFATSETMAIRIDKLRRNEHKIFAITLESDYLNPVSQKLDNIREYEDVCPEKWMGMKYGYPYYSTGHVIEKCAWGKPVSKLVTLIADFTNSLPEEANNIISQIQKEYPQIRMIVIANMAGGLKKSDLVESVKSEKLNAAVLNEAIQNVSTKYTLIARNLGFFTNDSRLERLIRIINYAAADVVSGSNQNTSGHWKLDCYQTKMRNFELKVVEGYDLSFNSCIYCDYSGGPFISKTDFLLKHPFSDFKNNEIMLIDWFYRLSLKDLRVMNCPDSMFFTESISNIVKLSKQDWLPFAKKWQLNFVTISNNRIEFLCSDLKMSCKWPAKGMLSMPCCLQRLSSTLKYFMKQATAAGIPSEIEGGTNVGAIKFYGTLPWELDADVNYVSMGGNQAKLRKLIPKFRKDGYTLQETSNISNCENEKNRTKVNCGYFALRAWGWRVECWGVHYLSRWRQLANKNHNQSSTKVLVDGEWLETYPNPALVARNLYGDDIFKHIEHWIQLGQKSSWKAAKSGSFIKCSKPGSHACLDQYLPVGNLQFQQVWI